MIPVMIVSVAVTAGAPPIRRDIAIDTAAAAVGRSQHIGREIEIVFDGLGDYAAFHDLDPADPSKANSWSLAIQSKLDRTQP